MAKSQYLIFAHSDEKVTRYLRVLAWLKEYVAVFSWYLPTIKLSPTVLMFLYNPIKTATHYFYRFRLSQSEPSCSWQIQRAFTIWGKDKICCIAKMLLECCFHMYYRTTSWNWSQHNVHGNVLVNQFPLTGHESQRTIYEACAAKKCLFKIFVVVIPKEGFADVAPPIILLVWHRI